MSQFTQPPYDDPIITPSESLLVKSKPCLTNETIQIGAKLTEILSCIPYAINSEPVLNKIESILIERDTFGSSLDEIIQHLDGVDDIKKKIRDLRKKLDNKIADQVVSVLETTKTAELLRTPNPIMSPPRAIMRNGHPILVSAYNPYVTESTDFHISSYSDMTPEEKEKFRSKNIRRLKTKIITSYHTDILQSSKTDSTKIRPQSGYFNINMESEAVDKASSSLEKFFSLASDILPNLNSTLCNFTNISEKLSEKLDQVNVEDAIKASSSISKDLVDNLDIGQFLTTCGKTGSVILLLSIILYSVHNWTENSRLHISIAILITGVLNREFILRTIKDIFAFIHNSINKTTPQTGAIDSLSIFISCIMSALAVADARIAKIPEVVLKNVGNFHNIKKNFESIFTYCLDCFMKVMDYFKMSKYIPDSIKYAGFSRSDIEQFVKTSRKLMTDNENGDLLPNEVNYMIICAHTNLCEELMTDSTTEKLSRDMVNLLKSQHTALLAIRKQLGSFLGVKDGRRAEPVAIMLRGSPGCFKSQTADFLMTKLLMEILTDEDFSEFKKDISRLIYNRCNETKFWDGMTRFKLVCLFDDFMQVRDAIGMSDNECLDIIRAVNEQPYLLHMASVTDKGNFFFRCKYIVATTNVKDFQPESIVDPRALKRRFDFVYTVSPKAEYAFDSSVCLFDRTVDVSKLPLGHRNVPNIYPSFLEFHEYDLISNTHTGIVCSFDQMLERAIDKKGKKDIWFEQKKESIDRILEEERISRNLPSEEFQEAPEFIPTEKKCKNFALPSGKIIQMEIVDGTPDTCELLASTHNGYWQLPGVPFVEKVISDTLTLSIFNRFQDINLADKVIEFLKKVHSILNVLHREVSFDYIYDRTIYSVDNTSLTIEDVLDLDEDEILHMFAYDQKDAKTILYSSKLKTSARYFKKIVKDLSKDFSNFFKHTYYKLNTCASIFHQTLSDNPQLAVLFTMIFIPPIATFLYRLTTNGSKKVTIVHQSFTKNSPTGVKNAKNGLSKITHLKPQMGDMLDRQAGELVQLMRKRNCFEIRMETLSGDMVKHGYGTVVRGHVMLIPCHFVTVSALGVEEFPELLDKKVTFTREGSDKKYAYTLTIKEFLDCARQHDELTIKDLILLEMPRTFQPSPDIVKFFCLESELISEPRFMSKLMAPRSGLATEIILEASLISSSIRVESSLLDYDLNNGFEYRAYTDSGDCGSLLLKMDSSSGCRKIVGIHVAGNSVGMGYSTSISQELLTRAILCIKPLSRVEDCELPIVAQSGYEVVDERFRVLGKYHKSYITPTSTNISKSLLYEKWGNATTKPCVLHPFVSTSHGFVDPQINFLKKMCPPQHRLQEDILTACRDDLMDHLFSLNMSEASVPKRVFTIEESVCGLSGQSQFGPIPRSTSMGIPWKDESQGKKGKTAMFGSEQSVDWTNPLAIKLKETIETNIENMKCSLRPVYIYQDFLKDDRIKISKAEEGKTRGVSCSPVDFTVLCRMYFGAFCLFLNLNWLDVAVALSANPYSKDWHLIAQKLSQFNTKSYTKSNFAGDFGNFDGSLHVCIMYLILDIINAWYGDDPEGSRIRSILWMDIVFSRHLLKDVLYEWYGSLPSGNPLTPIINSLYNHIAHRYCWVRLTNTRLIEYRYNVYLITLGDDSSGTVSEKFSDRFNELAFVGPMAELGLKYTPDTKEVTGNVLRSLSEITFLKRSFRYSNELNRIVGPLNLQVILEMAYWTKRTDMANNITKDTFDIAMRELSLHGKDVFSTHSKLMVDAYREVFKTSPINTSYSTLLSIVSETEAWL